MSRRIQNCQPPHVFGVHGDWGSGQTSFMRQLQHELGGVLPENDGSIAPGTNLPGSLRAVGSPAAKVVSVWFDAWRYQNEAVPVVALIHEMHRQLPMQAVVKNELKKLGSVVSVCQKTRVPLAESHPTPARRFLQICAKTTSCPSFPGAQGAFQLNFHCIILPQGAQKVHLPSPHHHKQAVQ